MASSSAAAEAQIKSEIARLTATINQHKAQQKHPSSWSGGGYHGHKSHYTPYPKANKYVNPNYNPPNKYARPGSNVGVASGSDSTSNVAPAPVMGTEGLPNASTSPDASMEAGPSSTIPPPTASVPGQTKEVVLNGVAFESSGRSLVRKDLPKTSKPVSVGKVSSSARSGVPPPYARKPGHVPPSRRFRAKARRGRGRNMTLNNTGRPFPTRKAPKRKLIDKPCSRFTTTGLCSRGLTCPYQHDPTKIAICWNFLQDNCSNTAETCNLSHDPTPERTPLCVHFLNKGRCTRENCLFPHVNVGQRNGVCRDFAVLGYCERGLECTHQHVRECPDFAEKGTCETKGCKLPHVIRANRTRTAASATTKNPSTSAIQMDTSMDSESDDKVAPMLTAEDGQLGDDFISLTFRESDSDDEGNDDDDEGDDDEESGDDDEEDDEQDEPDLEVHM